MDKLRDSKEKAQSSYWVSPLQDKNSGRITVATRTTTTTFNVQTYFCLPVDPNWLEGLLPQAIVAAAANGMLWA